jgi:hypothetical protein
MLTDLLRSNRYFMPGTAYVIFVAWIYSVKPNPVLESYGVTAALLFAIAAWFGILLDGVEPKRQQDLTVLHAGGYVRYAQARMALLGLAALACTLYAVAVPLLRHSFDRGVTVTDLVLAFYSHGLAFALGAGISWLAVTVSRKQTEMLGVLLVVICASLGAGGIAEVLPGWSAWLTWLLPPVYQLLGGLFGSGNRAVDLAYPLVYAAVLYMVIVKRFVSRR